MEGKSWKSAMADATEHKVLKTIGSLLDDSGGTLSAGELDDLKDCWKILRLISSMKGDSAVSGDTGASVDVPSPASLIK